LYPEHSASYAGRVEKLGYCFFDLNEAGYAGSVERQSKSTQPTPEIFTFACKKY
jgi:hypothetical protein